MSKKKKKNTRNKIPNRTRKTKAGRVQTIMFATLIALIVLIVGVMVYAGVAKHQEDAAGRASFDYSRYPVMGDPDAPVKIVEFGDYKCPVCKRFDEQIVSQLKKDYIDSGKAAYYFANFPIIQGSMPAALASESVYHRQPELFWQFHDALYANQGPEDEDWATAERITKIGVTHVEGLNGDQLMKDIQNETYKTAVEQDRQKALNLGLNSTPSVFVNGERVAVTSYEALKAVIDQAYDKAK
ncbi:MAG TPA: thioredoxin domain-containing protein [Bacillales bacterium]|nr:thioredoxin domain-containing protein [Bacillales bacterium]